MTSQSTEPGTDLRTAQRDMIRKTWEDLVATADQVEGQSLVGGKENEATLDLLIGVPFIVTSMTLRKGDITVKSSAGDYLRDYVSVEAVIHPDYEARFKRPRVVFNDGSTGIYRQSVKYLEAKGFVDCDKALPEEGEANATRYDIPFVTSPEYPLEFDVQLLCPEGLRKSDYKGPYGDAQTWYFA